MAIGDQKGIWINRDNVVLAYEAGESLYYEDRVRVINELVFKDENGPFWVRSHGTTEIGCVVEISEVLETGISLADVPIAVSSIGTPNASGIAIVTLTDGSTQDLDLSSLLDDTNLARTVSGSVDASGIATFVRDDATTYTVDMSAFLDNTNLARITQVDIDFEAGTLVLTRDDATIVQTTFTLPSVDQNLCYNVDDSANPLISYKATTQKYTGGSTTQEIKINKMVIFGTDYVFTNKVVFQDVNGQDPLAFEDVVTEVKAQLDAASVSYENVYFYFDETVDALTETRYTLEIVSTETYASGSDIQLQVIRGGTTPELYGAIDSPPVPNVKSYKKEVISGVESWYLWDGSSYVPTSAPDFTGKTVTFECCKNCPDISQDTGNAIEKREDGLFVEQLEILDSATCYREANYIGPADAWDGEGTRNPTTDDMYARGWTDNLVLVPFPSPIQYVSNNEIVSGAEDAIASAIQTQLQSAPFNFNVTKIKVEITEPTVGNFQLHYWFESADYAPQSVADGLIVGESPTGQQQRYQADPFTGQIEIEPIYYKLESKDGVKTWYQWDSSTNTYSVIAEPDVSNATLSCCPDCSAISNELGNALENKGDGLFVQEQERFPTKVAQLDPNTDSLPTDVIVGDYVYVTASGSFGDIENVNNLTQGDLVFYLNLSGDNDTTNLQNWSAVQRNIDDAFVNRTSIEDDPQIISLPANTPVTVNSVYLSFGEIRGVTVWDSAGENITDSVSINIATDKKSVDIESLDTLLNVTVTMRGVPVI